MTTKNTLNLILFGLVIIGLFVVCTIFMLSYKEAQTIPSGNSQSQSTQPQEQVLPEETKEMKLISAGYSAKYGSPSNRWVSFEDPQGNICVYWKSSNATYWFKEVIKRQ